MEKIENISKYQPQLSKYKKVQGALKKYIFFVPLIAVVLGFIVVAKIASTTGVFRPEFEIKYEEFVEPDFKIKEGSKLNSIREKMSDNKNIQKDRVVSGKDIVAVDFGAKVIGDNNHTLLPENEKPQTPADLPSLVGTDTASSSVHSARNSSEVNLKERDRVANNSSPNERKYGKRLHTRKNTTVAYYKVDKDTSRTPMPVVDPAPIFNIIRVNDADKRKFIKCFVQGNQDLIPGGFLKFRLGEESTINSIVYPRNTIFKGEVQINKNIVTINVSRIGTEDVLLEVFDKDFSHGLAIEMPKNKEVESTMDEGLYQGAYEYGQTLPVQAVQTVARALISKKRQKKSIVNINDGYLVYISEVEKDKKLNAKR